MRNHPDAVMIFAAGFGTRMGALARSRPKSLIKVAGRPLIDHALALAEQAGIGQVAVNLHYLPEQLEEHLAGRGVDLSHETPEILETGGGLRHALPLLGDGPVYTLNSDAIWHGPNPLTRLAQAWDPDRMDALLMLIPPRMAMGHPGAGDFTVDTGGRLARGPDFIYSGAQIIKTDLLHGIEEKVFSLNVIWDQMLKTQRLFGLTYAGWWCDVGQPESIALAETMLSQSDV